MGSRVRVPPRSPCFSNKTRTFRASHLEYLYERLARFALRLANSCSGAVPSQWRPGARWPPAAGETWWTCRAATKGRCPLGRRPPRGRVAAPPGGDVGQWLVPAGSLPPITGLRLEPTDEVDQSVKHERAPGWNAASGKDDGRMCPC
jgi:hypothetical protein